jgi:hypothetical protein
MCGCRHGVLLHVVGLWVWCGVHQATPRGIAGCAQAAQVSKLQYWIHPTQLTSQQDRRV